MLQGFARGLARVAFLQNITLLAINKKARASFLKRREKAKSCKNSGETEEVLFFRLLQVKVPKCGVIPYVSPLTSKYICPYYKLKNECFKS